MPYVVMVNDNFHYMDADERYLHGEFDDPDVATERCRRIVDEYLASALKPGMTAAELWESYMAFGEDPFIVSKGVPPASFSAWGYAKERCEALGSEAPAPR
jgi:hypothetical protein